MNFLEIKTLILNYLRRPESEIGDEVEDAINRVCQRSVANHDFLVLERTIEGTYTSAAAIVTFATLFGSVSVKHVNSAQVLTGSGGSYGDPLKIVSYGELQKWRQRQRDAGGGTTANLINSDYVGFYLGDANMVTNFGLYPVPTGAEYVLFHVNTWLPELTAITDTNFLLTNFPHFVAHAVCVDLFFYLNSDDRSRFTKETVADEWNSIIQWDTKLRATTGPTL